MRKRNEYLIGSLLVVLLIILNFPLLQDGVVLEEDVEQEWRDQVNRTDPVNGRLFLVYRGCIHGC